MTRWLSDIDTHDAIRDLCEAVAELAAANAVLIGTDAAAGALGKARSLSERMDELDREWMLS